MSIYKINQNLPLNQKIQLLNNMIVELNGKMEQAKFDKNELDSLYDQSGFSGIRMFNRDVYLGNTLGTYTNWAHVKAESGYSIWKYPVTDYTYDTKNALYMDDSVLNLRGQAGAETATIFDTVFVYTGSYTDVTTEAGSDNGTAFTILEDTTDFVYLGANTTFNGVAFEFETRASGVTLKAEYWNGSAWTTFTPTDNTNSMQSDGYLNWGILTGWTPNTVNSVSRYWVRLSTTVVPVTPPTVFLAIPYNSVPALLSMSSAQIFAEEWAWCYYNGYVYVTLRNTGNTSYEGDYFINSSSSNTNKQNYFIYNHEFKTDHRNSN
jgi:hypothetical protein